MPLITFGVSRFIVCIISNWMIMVRFDGVYPLNEEIAGTAFYDGVAGAGSFLGTGDWF